MRADFKMAEGGPQCLEHQKTEIEALFSTTLKRKDTWLVQFS